MLVVEDPDRQYVPGGQLIGKVEFCGHYVPGGQMLQDELDFCPGRLLYVPEGHEILVILSGQ
jgi:hypothetical protein